MNKNPIGIFDSGVGGLSVWKELIKVLPNESMLYYADSANCPYGSKSQADIIEYSKRIVDFFLSRNVKLIVVACNTATAAAIDTLRKCYSIPFVGMEPAIKPAALKTQKGIVGVLATEGTFNGRLFKETKSRYASDIQVEITVGKGFVELVEKGDFDSELAQKTVRNIIKPLLSKGIDQLVLACTHYPFLTNLIEAESLNQDLEIINPAPSVALQAYNLLNQNRILNTLEEPPRYEFYTSGTLSTLKLLVNKINSNESSIFQVMQL